MLIESTNRPYWMNRHVSYTATPPPIAQNGVHRTWNILYLLFIYPHMNENSVKYQKSLKRGTSYSDEPRKF